VVGLFLSVLAFATPVRGLVFDAAVASCPLVLGGGGFEAAAAAFIFTMMRAIDVCVLVLRQGRCLLY
jgi:hypothetical protein